MSPEANCADRILTQYDRDVVQLHPKKFDILKILERVAQKLEDVRAI